MRIEPDHRKFVQTIIDNIKKNGFPQKKVAFSLDAMYESAEKKGVNFNKVLQTLDEIQIAHQKTPEKIIFFPKKEAPIQTPGQTSEQSQSSHEDPVKNAFAGVDPSMFKNMNMTDMISAAKQMMQNMDPQQLESMKNMYENMSEEDRAEMLEKAKKMGLF